MVEIKRMPDGSLWQRLNGWASSEPVISPDGYVHVVGANGVTRWKARTQEIALAWMLEDQPPVPPIPPGAEPLVPECNMRFGMAPGQVRTFVVTIGQGINGISVDLMGHTIETDAKFAWRFPDGRVFPPPGSDHALGTVGAGRMSLMGQAGGWQANLPDLYLPMGQHVLTLTAAAPSDLRLWVR